MAPPQIFISYRRDDAAGYARAIYDELARHFGAERVFIDVDDIGAGQAFDEVIRSAVADAAVLLVLIGKRWQGERDGRPRLSEPGDFVRQEVAAALARGLRVIPVLLDGAAMPKAAQLPEELHPLARRNALAIDNSRFAADVARLVTALREDFGQAPAPRRPWTLGAAGLALLVVLGLAWRWLAPPLGGTSSRPEINGQWQATVIYDWPDARHVERFVFSGEAGGLHGSASFLGVPRGLAEGSVEPGGLRFATRTAEMGISIEAVHRYHGRVVGSEIRFVMQTEGGASPHVPVEFVARRVGK